MLGYIDGDVDNITQYMAGDIRKMETVQLPSQVNVGVLWDRNNNSTYTSVLGTNAVQGWISYDPHAPQPSAIDTDLSNGRVSQSDLPTSNLAPYDGGNHDANMGDPATLQAFLIAAMNASPSQHYALFLDDHGGAWTGATWDNSSSTSQNQPHLQPKDIANAIAGAEAATGKHLDLLSFRTCLDATFETLYDFRSVVDVVTASEAITYPWTVQFDQILTKLASNPSMSAEQLGTTIVQTTGAYPGTGTPVDLALGVTRTSAYGNLATSLNAFAQAVTTSATTGDWSAMSQAEQQYCAQVRERVPGRTASGRSRTQCPNDRDLSGFMKGVANRATTQAIKSAAQAVLAALGQAIVTVVTQRRRRRDQHVPAPAGRPHTVRLPEPPLEHEPVRPVPGVRRHDPLVSVRHQAGAAGEPNLVVRDRPGPQLQAQAQAQPLHTLSGSWTVGTFSLDPAAQETWFQFQTVATGGPSDSVAITFQSSLGSLSLGLYDANGQLLGQVLSPTGPVERVGLNGLLAGTYYIRVSGTQGNPAYTLTINAPPSGVVAQDWTGANYSSDKAYDLGAVGAEGRGSSA